MDGDVDADGREILLSALRNTLVSGALIDQVFNFDRSGQLAVNDFEAGILQDLQSAVDIRIVEVTVRAVRVRPGCGILKQTAVAVLHAVTNPAGGNSLLALCNGVNDVLAIDSGGHRSAESGSLIRRHAGVQIGVDVEADVIGAQVVDDVELRIALEVRNFIGRYGFDEVNIARVVRCENRNVVCGKHELNGVQLDIGGIPVIRVLREDHAGLVVPFGQRERAAGNESRFTAPCVRGSNCAGGIFVAFRTFHCALRHREVGRERKQVEEVRAGRAENDGEGVAINSDVQVVRITVDRAEHVAVFSSSFGAGTTTPGILEVGRGQVAAVAPLEAVLHLDGVGHAVFGDRGHTIGKVRNHAVGGIGIQAAELEQRKDASVNGCIQGGVEVFRLAGDIDAQRVGVPIGRILEVLEPVRIGMNAFHGRSLHEQVIVVVDRAHGAGRHKHVFRLMHQGDALCKVGRRLDLGDQFVIGCPVRRRRYGRGFFGRRFGSFHRCFFRCGGGFFRGLRRAGSYEGNYQQDRRQHGKQLSKVHFLSSFIFWTLPNGCKKAIRSVNIKNILSVGAYAVNARFPAQRGEEIICSSRQPCDRCRGRSAAGTPRRTVPLHNGSEYGRDIRSACSAGSARRLPARCAGAYARYPDPEPARRTGAKPCTGGWATCSARPHPQFPQFCQDTLPQCAGTYGERPADRVQ
ncbi:hypothetical protein SDC9_80518 [bioreactor metagenome]|uniref:Uncharacterized protein n=1 Tax=bioreactor metagenome TaxID=1076179 RepID=A0A644YZZ0_9ZZZZ